MVCKVEKSEKTETRAQTESFAAKLGIDRAKNLDEKGREHTTKTSLCLIQRKDLPQTSKKPNSPPLNL